MSVGAFSASASADELGGAIWRQKDGRMISLSDLLGDLNSAAHVVVGETHGFKPHQDNEALLISALAERGKYPKLVLEMLDQDGARRLAHFRTRHPEDVSGLAQALNWQDSGWPSFDFYRPVFAAAFRAKLRILGGDIAGPRAGDPGPLEHNVDSEIVESWKGTMSIAHCGLIGPIELDAAARFQIARDAAMARAAVADQDGRTSLTIAGLAHARADRGVARHIAALGAEAAPTVSVALIEKTASADPSSYLPESVNGRPAFDYIWFTSARTTSNTCERLRDKGLLK